MDINGGVGCTDMTTVCSGSHRWGSWCVDINGGVGCPHMTTVCSGSHRGG